MAVATVFGNIVPYNYGKKTEVSLTAGLVYGAPWTRDASINTWNCGGLICPEITRRTLLNILDEDGTVGGYAGQNWDNIIWAIGSWQQYVYTGDKEFLKTAYSAVKKTLARFEDEYFDAETGLFRGPACYGDGVAAYGDKYAVTKQSGIASYPEFKTMKLTTLSLNCLFYAAYVIAGREAELFGDSADFAEKAESLKANINRLLWDGERGIYYYYIDEDGSETAFEALGNAFAILFGIADGEKALSIAKVQYRSPHGVPCVYPSYERYSSLGEGCFGRHSGTVWPFIQGFWADAAARCGRKDLFFDEFMKQTENAVNSCGFFEIYHPETGKPYGGWQEEKGEMFEWGPIEFQTWSATAYLRNVYMDIFGMRFKEDGISFEPCGLPLCEHMTLTGIKYRECEMDIELKGFGDTLKSFKLNGVESEPFIPSTVDGKFNIEITLG